MIAQTRSGLFSIFHPSYPFFLPINRITIFPIKKTVKLNLKCHFRQNDLQIINLKNRIVSFLISICVCRYGMVLGNARCVVCPALFEPVIFPKYRDVK